MARSTPGDPRAAALARKKAVATALLVAAAAVLVAMQWLRHVRPGWGVDLVATMAEAALVGGLADWFAVVALFRHPMGLPIPHTAIIPARKDAIGKNLADFICDNFLGKQQVIEKLGQIDVARKLAERLADEATSARIANLTVRAIPHVIRSLNSEELHDFIHRLTRDRLAQTDLSDIAAFGLAQLTADGRHEELVDSALASVRDTLNDDGTRSEITALVEKELWSILKYIGLKTYTAEKITEKLVAGTTTLVTEMAGDPGHEMRRRISARIQALIERLRTDPRLRRRINALRDQLLDNSELSAYLRGLWEELVQWVEADTASADSVIATRVRGATRKLGTLLLEDDDMRAWINTSLREAVDPLVDRYRENIREFIIERIHKWSAEELTRELELSVGADLQYIRYNGTAVGAVIGALIFLVLQGAGALLG